MPEPVWGVRVNDLPENKFGQNEKPISEKPVGILWQSFQIGTIGTTSSLENTLPSQLELPSFNESWKKFPNKDFGLLKEFLGAVGTVHATTAEAEGDFSRQKFSRTGRESLRSFGIQLEIHLEPWEEISECLEYYNL